MDDSYTQEIDVDTRVKSLLQVYGYKQLTDFREQAGSAFTEEMGEIFSKSSKHGKGKARPDVMLKVKVGHEDIYVIIEDKLNKNKLISTTNGKLNVDDSAIRDFAVNGAYCYAKLLLDANYCKNLVIVGVAGNNEDHLKVDAYFIAKSNKTNKLEIVKMFSNKHGELSFLIKSNFEILYKKTKEEFEVKYMETLDEVKLTVQKYLTEEVKKYSSEISRERVLACQDFLTKLDNLTSDDIKDDDDDIKANDIVVESKSADDIKDDIKVKDVVKSTNSESNANIKMVKLHMSIKGFHDVKVDAYFNGNNVKYYLVQGSMWVKPKTLTDVEIETKYNTNAGGIKNKNSLIRSIKLVDDFIKDGSISIVNSGKTLFVNKDIEFNAPSTIGCMVKQSGAINGNDILVDDHGKKLGEILKDFGMK